MVIKQDELRAWVKDFHQELVQPGASSLCARFERTIEGQPSKVLRQILSSVLSILTLGHPLSKAMELHPEAFDEQFLTVVRYGEMHGELDSALQLYLAGPQDVIGLAE